MDANDFGSCVVYRTRLWLTALAVCLYTASARAELLLFPELSYAYSNSAGDTRGEWRPALNVFVSGTNEPYRLLVEGVISRDEYELERLQLGIDLYPTHTLWLGRFHNPIGYWNLRFHHGAFLQTGISRPALIDYAARGSPLVSHLAGVFAEGSVPVGIGRGYYVAALGVGAELTHDGLHAADPFRTGGSRAAAATLLASYQPQGDGEDEVGAFLGHAGIPMPALAPSAYVSQDLLGVFAYRAWPHARLHSAAHYVHHRLDASTAAFSYAYVQAESDWRRASLYVRGERAHQARADPFLALFPTFTPNRDVAGIRWRLAPNHALKLEWMATRAHIPATRTWILQWSASLP